MQKLHKVILCSNSGWFRRALEGGFKEAHAPSIELHDDDPDMLMHMIKFIYSGKPTYSVQEQHRKEDWMSEIILFTLDAYELANKYDVATYSTASAQIFNSFCGSSNRPDLVARLLNKKDIYQKLYFGISHDPQKLRQAFATQAFKASTKSRTSIFTCPSEEMKGFARECHEFALDYLDAMWSGYGSGSASSQSDSNVDAGPESSKRRKIGAVNFGLNRKC